MLKKVITFALLAGFCQAEDYDIDAMSKRAGYQEFMSGIMQDMANNPKEAKKWFEKSSAKGFDQADVSLGLLYVKGRGVKENRNQAYKYWKKAADLGNADAQTNLETLCTNTPQACK